MRDSGGGVGWGCLVEGPLHDGGVEAAGGEETRVVGEEAHAGHVGGVPAVLVAQRLSIQNNVNCNKNS